MPIDIVASRPHYLAHLLPVWRALPEGVRGDVYAPGSKGVIAMAATAGVRCSAEYPPKGRDPLLVSGGNDLSYARGRPVVLLEHGAGQTYEGDPAHRLDDPAHAGGRDRDAVSLFCHAREETAARDRARYPAAQVEIVGCPRLDRWHPLSPALTDPPDTPTVGLAWHWPADSVGVPEARWAWPHYDRLALEVLAMRYDVIGHAHPRAWGWLASEYRTVGIRTERDVDEFFARIDVLVADNTSVLPEYASARDRPVVFLNAPWYRRDVEHGCRFWDWPRGQVECDGPEGLVDAVAEALADGGGRAEARRAMTRSVYAYADGFASARVAGHIVARWG